MMGASQHVNVGSPGEPRVADNPQRDKKAMHTKRSVTERTLPVSTRGLRTAPSGSRVEGEHLP